MKRRLSIKLKLTLWYTSFMAVIAAACLGVILAVSGHVAENEAIRTLNFAVRTNLNEASLEEGRLKLSPEFRFYLNDVYLLIYGKNGALLSGQIPPEFPVETELENGITKYITGGGEGFYVQDFWISSGWEDGIWLRGVLKKPDSNRMLDTIFKVFSIILPFFILSAALGGYFIVKRMLAPVSDITRAAGTISEGKDLSARIGLSEGSDEVGRLASAFDHMFERLERSFEAEKQFASDASHELRTPTAVILAQCSYAKKHADSVAEYQEAMEVIERQAGKMSVLTERLLDITRLEQGTRRLQPEWFDFREMLREFAGEWEEGEKRIRLSLEAEEALLIYADPFLISRVVQNLLDNAKKYGRSGGETILRLRKQGANAVLEAEDNGIGIPKKALEKIWQRFYQVESSRTFGSGLGLGLSMVRQIVQLHGGEITVRSVFGEGSCFVVSLPIDGIPGGGCMDGVPDRKREEKKRWKNGGI